MNTLSPSYKWNQNKTKTLFSWENVCRGVPRDKPEPGSFSSTTKEAEKRNPGNEVVCFKWLPVIWTQQLFIDVCYYVAESKLYSCSWLLKTFLSAV